MRLQDELAGTENRLSQERRIYNEAANDYNTYRQKFPTVLIAGLIGFRLAGHNQCPEVFRQIFDARNRQWIPGPDKFAIEDGVFRKRNRPGGFSLRSRHKALWEAYNRNALQTNSLLSVY